MGLDLFNGPIPGQSLTGSPGGSPFERAPQYAELNDALEHVWNVLTQKRQVTRLILMLKKDIPAEYIARSIIMAGFGKGMWSPDVGLMMLRTVMAMIIGIANLKGIKVKIFNPDKEQNDFLDKFLDMAPEEGSSPLTESAVKPPQNFEGVLGGSL